MNFFFRSNFDGGRSLAIGITLASVIYFGTKFLVLSYMMLFS